MFSLIHTDRGVARVIDPADYPDEAAFEARVAEVMAQLVAENTDPKVKFYESRQPHLPQKLREMYGEKRQEGSGDEAAA